MIRRLAIITVACLVLSMSVMAATPAAAATLKVGPGEIYTTLQAAIAATAPGDIIEVASGTYVEIGQIVITHNLTIIGASKATTIIKPAQSTGSSGSSRGWFLVPAGVQFNLSNVTLDGAPYQIYQGIRSFGSGTINNNIIKNIEWESSGPGYLGTAFVVMGSYNMTFSNNTFTDIGRVGMLAFGTGVTGARMINNTYTGKGLGNWLDYGIEVGGGATAIITGNNIADCLGESVTTPPWRSAGIIVVDYFGVPGNQATITDNTLTTNTFGIAVVDTTNVGIVVATFNNIAGNTLAGAKLTGPGTLNATSNWWGSSTGPSGEGPGTGDAVGVEIDFAPWLTYATPSGTHWDSQRTYRVRNLDGTRADNLITSVDLHIAEELENGLIATEGLEGLLPGAVLYLAFTDGSEIQLEMYGLIGELRRSRRVLTLWSVSDLNSSFTAASLSALVRYSRGGELWRLGSVSLNVQIEGDPSEGVQHMYASFKPRLNS